MFIVINKGKLIFISLSFIIISIICGGSYNIFLKRNTYAKLPVDNQTNYLILIEIDEKILYLFQDGKCIKKYPISSGKPELPSPIGEWKIIDKGNWGDGFGGRWMGLNVRWGTYGIHGTTKSSSIGRAASHGCIRMYNKDIKELYDIVPIGTTVIIKNGPYGPFGTGFRNLRPGDSGADVLAVQKRLKELGYFNGDETGIYEDDLKQAIYKFQKDNYLRIKYTLTRIDYNTMGFMEFE